MALTREDIERDYDVDETGLIHSPGKFEGEMLYVPYFWEIFMVGGADEDDGNVLTFGITDDDRKLFPELGTTEKLYLEESDQGFVNSSSA
jgi:hypothetical protein